MYIKATVARCHPHAQGRKVSPTSQSTPHHELQLQPLASTGREREMEKHNNNEEAEEEHDRSFI
jgi:hypothetical protein